MLNSITKVEETNQDGITVVTFKANGEEGQAILKMNGSSFELIDFFHGECDEEELERETAMYLWG